MVTDMSNTLSAQVAVLGSMLISPELVGEVLTKVRPDDFTDGRCRNVFLAIRALFSAGETVDPVTVRGKLGGTVDDGWDRFLLETMQVTPTAKRIWEYVPIMREQARMQQIVHIGGLLQVCNDSDRARELIGQLNGLLSERQGVKRLNMDELLLNFYDRHTHPHQYLTWGLDKLNERIYAESGDMVVIGGSPSTGKTALAVNFAWHMAESQRVGFYSLETNRYKLADRLMANLAGIELADIKHGEISEEEWANVTRISPSLRKRQIELIEASGMTTNDIQADALANRYEIIFVDYLQIIAANNPRENRTNQVGQISRDLQRLSHANGITVIALSQLSRMSEEEEPTMSDLRESGQIEQDADIIMLLFLEEPQRPDKSRRVLKIGKNKDGERGKFFLVFDGAHQRFRESVLDAPVASVSKPRKKRPAQMSFEELHGGVPDPDPFEEQDRQRGES